MTLYLFVDPRGWPSPLDADLLTAILQSRLPVEIRGRRVGERWFDELPSSPSEDCTVFVLLTLAPAPGWSTAVDKWLSPSHRLYLLYLDNVSPVDVREFARLTANQALARAPYRVAQLNAVGLENAMAWAASILQKVTEIPPTVPVLKISPARWRHLPSNPQDTYYYPEQFTTSMQGAAGYRLVAASHRGKTHAHQGTFREDAVALAATRYWNVMAVGDGAGTADLARVGSNLAVKR